MEIAPAALTPRETEVVLLVGAGRSSKQIALALHISPKTVESYIEHARLKLGAANRSHLMVRAAALGLFKGGGAGQLAAPSGGPSSAIDADPLNQPVLFTAAACSARSWS